MKVGDLVKPNLRVWKMRLYKGELGIVLKLFNDPRDGLCEPHCLVSWTNWPGSVLTCNAYIKVAK